MSTKRYATASDFAKWGERAKDMSDYALIYSAKDAMKAAQAVGRHDPVAEGWYTDEASVYMRELTKRRSGTPTMRGRNPCGCGCGGKPGRCGNPPGRSERAYNLRSELTEIDSAIREFQSARKSWDTHTLERYLDSSLHGLLHRVTTGALPTHKDATRLKEALDSVAYGLQSLKGDVIQEMLSYNARTSNPNGFSAKDVFDFFDDSDDPVDEAPYAEFEHFIGGPSSVIHPGGILRGAKLPDKYVEYLNQTGIRVGRYGKRAGSSGKLAWFVVAPDFSSPTSFARALYRALIPKTDLHYSEVALHHAPLFVFSPLTGNTLRYDAPGKLVE